VEDNYLGVETEGEESEESDDAEESGLESDTEYEIRETKRGKFESRGEDAPGITTERESKGGEEAPHVPVPPHQDQDQDQDRDRELALHIREMDLKVPYRARTLPNAWRDAEINALRIAMRKYGKDYELIRADPLYAEILKARFHPFPPS